MPSLRQLLALHPLLLTVDTCSQRCEAALWRAGAALNSKDISPLTATSVEGEASAALPSAMSRVLSSIGAFQVGDLNAVAFCDGPGSVLGVRLAAASLRAWRAVNPALELYSFRSLSLLAIESANASGAAIIADARRDTWHVVLPSAPHELLRLPTCELASRGPLATPDNFRRWSPLPLGVDVSLLPYSATRLLSQAPDEPFFHPAPEPDAFMHEQPSYVAWTPRVHQAPDVNAGAKS